MNDKEREILWKYLADAYGLADSQEKIMRLSMDSEVSGYSLKEANKLRKSIAKKMKNSKLKLNNNFLNMDEKSEQEKYF